MFHYTKSFGALALDYGVQQGSGFPNLHDGIVPVSIVDDAAHFVARTYPQFTFVHNMAATAAVYGLIGLHALTYPVLLKGYGQIDQNSDVVCQPSVLDLRTANQTTATLSGGLPRGTAAPTCEILAGTTTVQPDNLTGPWFYVFDFSGDILQPPPLPILLRPGEYLWFGGPTVNLAVSPALWWEEWPFGLQPNPTAQI